jgi:hypothetical protein
MPLPSQKFLADANAIEGIRLPVEVDLNQTNSTITTWRSQPHTPAGLRLSVRALSGDSLRSSSRMLMQEFFNLNYA